MEYNYTLIIPHYNIPKLLRRLLSTVPHREDLQVIVVDDCSTKELDELANVQKEYDWVEWYSTGTNGGGGKARNIGLDHAKGKYLIFADADDYFLPSLDQILTDYSVSEFDILYFSVISLDSETFNITKRGLHVSNYINSLSYDEAYKMKFQFTSPWAKFISLYLVKSHNIRFEESEISNDVLFSTLIDYHANITKIDKLAIYCLTDRIESVSKILTPERALKRLKIDIERINFLKEKNIMVSLPIDHLVIAYNQICNQNDKHRRIEAYQLLRCVGISYCTLKKTMLKLKLIYIVKSILEIICRNRKH